MGDYERIRLVTLGGPRVGKSAIVKRFLFNTFMEKYKPTVEDLYNKEYDFGSITLKLDILDTAGDLQFPAMRRLSIETAHAFLLVYSIDSVVSFDIVKGCFQEIQEQRADFENIPIVIAGNKIDVGIVQIEVEFDEVSEWISNNLPKLRGKIMECSAKEDKNIRELFKTFLQLSKIPIESEECSGLKRRSSAHAGSKSTKNRSSSSSKTPPVQPSSPSFTTCSFSGSGCASGRNSGYNTPTSKGPASPSALSHAQFLTEESAFSRNKPRSRSLIRRCSKKVKKQVQDASGNAAGDCHIT